jgi:hypothetical protein
MSMYEGPSVSHDIFWWEGWGSAYNVAKQDIE